MTKSIENSVKSEYEIIKKELDDIEQFFIQDVVFRNINKYKHINVESE